jgi:hypothetical protein
MGDIIKLQPKEKKTDFTNSNYQIEKFTMTWEDLGLFYEGTLQINSVLMDTYNESESK